MIFNLYFHHLKNHFISYVNLTTLLVTLPITGCINLQQKAGDYLTFEEAGFETDTPNRESNYFLIFNINRIPDSGTIIHVVYENPFDANNPIEKYKPFPVDETKLALRSPSLQQIPKAGTYKVWISAKTVPNNKPIFDAIVKVIKE